MNAPYHQQPEAWETDDARTATGRAAGTALVPRDPTTAANLASPRLLEGARRALAEAATLPELTPLIAQAEVVRLAARKAHLSREAQNAWAEYALDAERKAGALLTRLAETRGLAPGGRPAETGDRVSRVSAPKPPTLVELGVADEPGLARQRSSRWQLLASIPEPAFAQLKAEVQADPEAVLTRRAALDLARRLRGPGAHARAHEARLAAVHASVRAGAGAPAAWPVFDAVEAAESLDFLRRLKGTPVRAHVAMTSPAFWMLRTYTDGDPRELGQEAAPQDYVRNLCDVLDAVGDVLIPEAVLLLNLGDTYASQPGRYRGDPERTRGISTQAVRANGTAPDGRRFDVARKSLCLIPERVALELALRRGWRVAARIAWVQVGHGPENVHDRPAQGWEVLYVLTRAEHCYWRRTTGEQDDPTDDWWPIRVGRGGAAGGHLAPFPEELVERALRHASPEGGTVLDPFAGSATVRDVAVRMGRRFLGCDLLGEPAAGGPR